jgi:hypothetical protein
MLSFGFIGVYILEHIQNDIKDLKINPEKLLENILKFYFDNFNDSNIKNNDKLIKTFPNLYSVNKLIYSNLITKKEFILVKILLDIYYHFYNNTKSNISNTNILEVIDTMLLLYKIIDDENFKTIMVKIKGNSEIRKVYSNLYLN